MKKTRTPTAVTSLIFTLITVLFWAAFQVYRALTTKPAPIVPDEIIRPLDPNLDNNVLNSLSGRLYFNESDLPNTVASREAIQALPTPPEATQTPAGTPLPLPSESPVASGSPAPTGSPSPTP
jgi:hypothetical protein